MTFVDGRQHDFWRVDEDRLRAALALSGRTVTGSAGREVPAMCKPGRVGRMTRWLRSGGLITPAGRARLGLFSRSQTPTVNVAAPT